MGGSPRGGHRRTLGGALGALVTLAPLLLGACERVIGYEWVDPPISLGDAAGGDADGAPPHVELGFYEELGYRALRDGDPCPIVFGLQGGTWIMPAVRATGLGGYPRIGCRVETDAGERVGEATTQVRLYLATDGALEVQSFPIAIYHAPPRQDEDVDDLDGQRATLSCDLDDLGGRSAGVAVRVVLDGP